jgi:hypothetical protein
LIKNATLLFTITCLISSNSYGMQQESKFRRNIIIAGKILGGFGCMALAVTVAQDGGDLAQRAKVPSYGGQDKAFFRNASWHSGLSALATIILGGISLHSAWATSR